MKIFDVQSQIDESGEHILGAQDTGSHACYLIYGVMKPKEKGRKLLPGKGHEEIFLALQGRFKITGHNTGAIEKGEAIHLKGEETCWLENTSGSEAIYVISGGHSGGSHH